MSGRENRQSLLLPILLPVGILALIALVLYGFSRILLNITSTAATVVACIAAVAVVGLATFVASRPRVGASSLFSVVGGVAGVAMLVGGLALLAAPPAEEGEGGGTEGPVVTLAAPAGASANGFSTNKLSVPSEEAFTIEFDNEEAGVQHNVVIFDGKDEEAPALFTGEVVIGPKTTPYSVDALPEGNYFFHCEIHPTTMTGEVIAKPGSGGGPSGDQGGGAGSPTIAAQGTAFNTSELAFKAETPTPLVFDNQDDAAVTGPHNLSIYDGDAALFTGDLINGPQQVTYDIPALKPGEYQFHCDVHPDMAGTVTVT
ncbi:MAG TPA: cupredoxin domain-containing protein [Actinomycetota bacterium]|jgi:plastocyanin|nr:cupredoxin domain-containing protein [Actinomycetota bacterium]